MDNLLKNNIKDFINIKSNTDVCNINKDILIKHFTSMIGGDDSLIFFSNLLHILKDCKKTCIDDINRSRIIDIILLYVENRIKKI